MLNNSKYLRISVVNTCNLSCYFCHNEGAEITGSKLSIDELEFACKIAKECGFTKFKLTGGEPTIRRDIVELVQRLSALGLDDFSMITNGSLLSKLANPLKEAGLQRINISLHTLNESKYEQLNVKQKVSLKRIIEGIDAALDAGFKNMKINFVYTGEQSDEDLEDILNFICKRDLTLVVLPVISANEQHLTTLEQLYEKFKMKNIASEKLIIDGEGIQKKLLTLHSGAKVLLRVDELSDKKPYYFCSTCQFKDSCREGIFPLRLSAEGQLIPCLASIENRMSIKELLLNKDETCLKQTFDSVKEWGNSNEEVYQ